MTVGSNVKSCYISIKSAQAGLESLALSSTSNENQTAFKEGQQMLEDVKNDLHEQVLFLAREEPQYK